MPNYVKLKEFSFLVPSKVDSYGAVDLYRLGLCLPNCPVSLDRLLAMSHRGSIYIRLVPENWGSWHQSESWFENNKALQDYLTERGWYFGCAWYNTQPMSVPLSYFHHQDCACHDCRRSMTYRQFLGIAKRMGVYPVLCSHCHKRISTKADVFYPQDWIRARRRHKYSHLWAYSLRDLFSYVYQGHGPLMGRFSMVTFCSGRCRAAYSLWQYNQKRTRKKETKCLLKAKQSLRELRRTLRRMGSPRVSPLRKTG